MVVYVYADFSGYSDIARGLGKCLGIELSPNFRMPFFARNPPDFWRRWNITLSDWFRDYVFTPLVRLREKVGRTRAYLALCAFLTLCLCGLWHGAAWTYVAFGAAHGLLLVGYYALRPGLQRVMRGRFWRSGWGRFTARMTAFHLLSLPVIFFFVQTLGDAWMFVRSIVFAAYNSDALVMLATLIVFGLPLLALDLAQERTGDLLIVRRLSPARRTLCYALTFAAIVLCGATGTHAFVYYQF
jgi:D-alanyl-lipoteichoic acid acyltransferase DltB (MBOAT superfamily)